MDEIRETALSYRHKWTYDDYVKLPEGAPYQLIGGELVLTPSPTSLHQRIAAKMVTQMRFFAEGHDLGEVFCAPMDVYFNQEETYQPDVFFIPWEKGKTVEESRINGAPDLVVEILSPSTAKDDLTSKFKTYEQYGVKEYWIIDPANKSIRVYHGEGGSFTLNQHIHVNGLIQSKVLSGFSIEAGYLFRRR